MEHAVPVAAGRCVQPPTGRNGLPARVARCVLLETATKRAGAG